MKDTFYLDTNEPDTCENQLLDQYASTIDGFEIKAGLQFRIKITVELDRVYEPLPPDPDTRDR